MAQYGNAQTLLILASFVLVCNLVPEANAQNSDIGNRIQRHALLSTSRSTAATVRSLARSATKRVASSFTPSKRVPLPSKRVPSQSKRIPSPSKRSVSPSKRVPSASLKRPTVMTTLARRSVSRRAPTLRATPNARSVAVSNTCSAITFSFVPLIPLLNEISASGVFSAFEFRLDISDNKGWRESTTYAFWPTDVKPFSVRVFQNSVVTWSSTIAWWAGDWSSFSSGQGNITTSACGGPYRVDVRATCVALIVNMTSALLNTDVHQVKMNLLPDGGPATETSLDGFNVFHTSAQPNTRYFWSVLGSWRDPGTYREIGQGIVTTPAGCPVRNQVRITSIACNQIAVDTTNVSPPPVRLKFVGTNGNGAATGIEVGGYDVTEPVPHKFIVRVAQSAHYTWSVVADSLWGDNHVVGESWRAGSGAFNTPVCRGPRDVSVSPTCRDLTFNLTKFIGNTDVSYIDIQVLNRDGGRLGSAELFPNYDTNVTKVVVNYVGDLDEPPVGAVVAWELYATYTHLENPVPWTLCQVYGCSTPVTTLQYRGSFVVPACTVKCLRQRVVHDPLTVVFCRSCTSATIGCSVELDSTGGLIQVTGVNYHSEQLILMEWSRTFSDLKPLTAYSFTCRGSLGETGSGTFVTPACR